MTVFAGERQASSLEVARVVADVPTIEPVLLGGQLRSSSGSVIGALTS